MHRAQSAEETYEHTPPSISDDCNLGPLLVDFNFDHPIQPYYHHPNAFPPEHSLTTPIPSHGAQLYDSSTLYNGQPPMGLDLLSSENYRELPYENTGSMNPEGDNAPLSRGQLAPAPQSDGRSSLVSQTRATKPMRPRKPNKKEDTHSTSPDESNTARQRGRPRLDTRDQTATEVFSLGIYYASEADFFKRRRTQIRLAQRAYRQRKETTISGLTKRVSELERTAKNMNKSFLDFNDKAIASGIHKWEPSLAQNLKTTMDYFLKSARQIADVDEEEDEQVSVLSARVYGSDDRPPENRSRPSRRPRLRSPSKGSSSHREKVRASPWGYGTVDQAQTDAGGTRRSREGMCPDRPGAALAKTDWSPTRSMQQYRVELPETALIKRSTGISVNKSLPLPSSYSSQETSFARRLLRQAVESAFRLMTSPDSSRQAILQLCKLAFCFSNSRGVIEHLQGLMLKTAREDLEVWQSPFLHIGGAGLHYPRGGLNGIDSPGPPPWWGAEAPIGPLRPVEPETPVGKELNVAQVIELAGFDGEWFDSNDVDQYLRSKGVYLDAQSTWVELEVPELLPSMTHFQTISSPTDSSMASSRGLQGPRMAESLFPDDPVMEGQDYFWNADTLGVPSLSDVNMDLLFGETKPPGPQVLDSTDAFDPQLYLDPILPDVLPTFNTTVKNYIDVEKFLSSRLTVFALSDRTDESSSTHSY